MERLHLTSNLKGLLEELKMYSSEEEISDFTQDILIEASEVTNEYKDDNNKSLKKIIYL